MAIGESSDSSPHAPVSKKTRVVWSLTGSGHRNACERRKPLLSGAFGSSRHPKTTNRVIITTACHTSHTSRPPATRRFGHPQKTRRDAPFNYRANRRLVCAPRRRACANGFRLPRLPPVRCARQSQRVCSAVAKRGTARNRGSRETKRNFPLYLQDFPQQRRRVDGRLPRRPRPKLERFFPTRRPLPWW